MNNDHNDFSNDFSDDFSDSFSNDFVANESSQNYQSNQYNQTQNNSYDWENAPTNLDIDSNEAYPTDVIPPSIVSNVASVVTATPNVFDGGKDSENINPFVNAPSTSTFVKDEFDNSTEKGKDEEIQLNFKDDVVYSYNNGSNENSKLSHNPINSNPISNDSISSDLINNDSINTINPIGNVLGANELDGYPEINSSNNYSHPTNYNNPNNPNNPNNLNNLNHSNHSNSDYDVIDKVIDKNLLDGNGVLGSNIDENNQENSNAVTENINLNVDEDENERENVLPLSQAQNVIDRAKSKAAPKGDLSKRVMGFGVIVGVILLVLWGGSERKTDSTSDKNKSQVLKPVPIEKSNLSNTLNSPDIGQSVTPMQPVEVASNASTVIETPPPVIIPAPPPAPPPIGNGDIPITVSEPAPKVEKASRQYAFQLRAGQQVMKSYEQNQSQLQVQTQVQAQQVRNDETRRINRGTVIPMMLIQPFRNDLPGAVKCQIMADIKDSKGVLLIPSGSIASVPFAPFRSDKRVFNRVDSPTVITLTDGREIELKGTVIDRKGFVGLEGKVRRSGDASFPKRLGRTMARVLTFGAASSVGGVGGGVIAEAGNSSIDSTYLYTATTGSYVELPIGTMFVFNVSGN